MTRLPAAFVIVVGLAVSCFFLWQEWQLEGGVWGFPLDDAWIHARFARNLSAGHGFSFNPGEPTPGSTSPLWVLLLAGLERLGIGFIPGALGLGVLLQLLTAGLVYRLADGVARSRWIGLMAGLITALTGRYVWGSLSGMEVSLFGFLSLAGLYYHVRRRGDLGSALASALFLGLATNARPEGYLLFALCLLDNGLSAVFPPRGTGSRKAQYLSGAAVLLVQLVVFATLVLPYLFFSLKTAGHIFPNTYYAKRGVVGPDLGRGLAYLRQAVGLWLFQDNPLLTLTFIPGVFHLLNRNRQGYPANLNLRLVALWVPVFLVVAAIQTPYLQNMGRYLIPLVPVVVFVGVMGALQIAEWMKGIDPVVRIRGRSVSAATALILCLALAYGVFGVWQWGRAYAWNVDNINRQQAELGRWASLNLPPDAIIATHDVGAIGYFSGRYILDTCGLISPDILPYLRKYAYAPGGYREGVYRFLQHRGAQYLITFPGQFPEIINSPRSQVLHVVEYPNNTGGEDVMGIWRLGTLPFSD
jgi:hypothetical protein